MKLHLRQQLVLAVSVMLLLCVLGVVLIGQRLQFLAIEEQATQRIESAASSAARRLMAGIEERYLDIDLMAKRLIGEDRLSTGRAQSLFDDIVRRYDGYAWLGLANAEGRVLAASHGDLLGSQVSERPWFVSGLRGAYVSDVHPALLLANVLPKGPDGLPPRLIDIAVPVHRGEEVNGVLAGHLNWAWVDQLLAEFELSPQRGIKRQVLLLDRQLRVIRGPRDLLGSTLPDVPELSHEDITPRYWRDGLWHSVAIYARSEGYFTSPGWIVVVRESQEDLLGLSERMRHDFWLAAVPLLLLFLGAVWWLGRHLARPIEAISAAAVAHGDIPMVHGCSEIEELRDSLIQMTEQLKAQQAMVEAEVQTRMAETQHLLRALNNHTLVTMADAQGNITYCNDLFCQTSGYSREEAIGQNHRIVKSGVHPDEFYREMWETLRAGRIWSGILANRHKNGDLYWVKSVIAPGIDAEGSPHAYVSVRTDITELIEMQQAQERLNRELLRNSTMVTLLSRTTATANEAFDRMDALARCLQEICTFMGWQVGHVYELAEDETGEPLLRSLNIWYASDAERYRAFIERSVGLSYRLGQGLPGLVLKNRGPVFTWWDHWNEKTSRRYAEAVAAGFTTALGMPVLAGDRVLGVIEFFSDGPQEVDDEFLDMLRNVGVQLGFVFQRHDNAVELQQAVDEANRANQAKSDFLSSMSHELRTPMNAIIGFAQMLEYDSGLNEDQRDNVDEILRASRHLLHLINEVLDLAKIESGKIDLSIEPVRVAPLIADCLQLTGVLATPRHIHILVGDFADIAVLADQLRLKQVLLNLVTNAIKYNHEAGRVHIEGRVTANGMYRLSVADTGPGIPEARIAELFQPFNRIAAENSQVEGTGIGLTICKRLIEQMGGAIGVANRPGNGATFWIELPLADQALLHHAPSNVHGGVVVGHQPLPTKLSVLCVDDNPTNLKLLNQMLSKRPGVEVLSAQHPNFGVELAMAYRPDLILLDINMPDIDGYQVLDILRANPATRAIPVIAVTANALPRDVQRGLEAGFANYLTKPIDVDLLLEVIDFYLEKEAQRYPLARDAFDPGI